MFFFSKISTLSSQQIVFISDLLSLYSFECFNENKQNFEIQKENIAVGNSCIFVQKSRNFYKNFQNTLLMDLFTGAELVPVYSLTF
jgi:hypothetical protein